MSRAEKARLITLIHVARNELQMDDATYRKIVSDNAGGKMSAGSCSQWELEKILGHMKKCGFKIKKPASAKPREERPIATGGEISKIRAIWLQLHAMGEVRNASEAALNAYVKRIAKVDDITWLRDDKAHVVIETLKKWAVRVALDKMRGQWLRLHEAGKRPPLSESALQGFIHQTMSLRNGREPMAYDNLIACWEQLRKELEEASRADVS